MFKSNQKEFTFSVFGDLLVEGVVTKLADDLCCGGRSPYALFQNLTSLTSTK